MIVSGQSPVSPRDAQRAAAASTEPTPTLDDAASGPITGAAKISAKGAMG
jgi:hypothetical protein